MENYNNMNAAMDENREIGWGEEVLGEEQQFVLLPEGEYDCIVDSVNYTRKTVDNVTCGYSEVVCRIKTPDGDVISMLTSGNIDKYIFIPIIVSASPILK